MVVPVSFPPRPLTPRQRDRRERVQAATCDLLARGGTEMLSMKLIAQTAGVAERTLFNIYGSKDRLVAAAARDRSEDVIAEAHRQGGNGAGFFDALPASLASRTLEAPEIARGFAAILVEHADMVGLPGIYETFAGGALRAMREAGEVAIEDPVFVSRLMCMRMVGTILWWAKRAIGDDALETHLRLATCQVLLPYAEPPLATTLREAVCTHTRTLSGLVAA
jgi:AcrR family transcriptional regulator